MFYYEIKMRMRNIKKKKPKPMFCRLMFASLLSICRFPQQ